MPLQGGQASAYPLYPQQVPHSSTPHFTAEESASQLLPSPTHNPLPPNPAHSSHHRGGVPHPITGAAQPHPWPPTSGQQGLPTIPSLAGTKRKQPQALHVASVDDDDDEDEDEGVRSQKSQKALIEEIEEQERQLASSSSSDDDDQNQSSSPTARAVDGVSLMSLSALSEGQKADLFERTAHWTRTELRYAWKIVRMFVEGMLQEEVSDTRI